jgi:hypothetical protein
MVKALNLEGTSHAFLSALEKGDHLSVDEKGKWKVAKKACFMDRIWSRHDPIQVLAIIEGLKKEMGRVENDIRLTVANELGETEPPLYLKTLLNISKMAVVRFSFIRSKAIKSEVRDLERYSCSLAARIHGRSEAPVNSVELEGRACTWKSKQHSLEDKSLSQDNLDNIARAAHYHQFMEMIDRDSQLFEEFMNWSIGKGLDPRAFIEFRWTVMKRLRSCHIDTHIASVSAKLLQFHDEAGERKDLSLQLGITKKHHSLLNKHETVVLENNWQLTWKKVEQIFKEKNFQPGDLIIGAGGLLNWNASEFGSWNPQIGNYNRADLEKDEVAGKPWYEQFPMIRHMSVEEAALVYGNVPKPGQAGWAVRASRQALKPRLSGLGSHAWQDLLLPNVQGGIDLRMSFGTYPPRFPRTFTEYPTLFAATQHARGESPDCNSFIPRCKAAVTYITEGEESKKGFALLRESHLSLQNRVTLFQVNGNSCASEVQSFFDRLLPSLSLPRFFRVKFWEGELTGPANYILGLPLKIIPTACLKKAYLGFFLLIFGARRKGYDNGSGYKTVFHSAQWKENRIDLPSKLVVDREDGKLTQPAM